MEHDDSKMETLNSVKAILGTTLHLGDRIESLTPDSQLLGAIPELDSMAVVNLITSLEEHYGFAIDDDEISADTFATLGSLVDFVDRKLSS